MLDPTRLTGLGDLKAATSKKGSTVDAEFKEVFERTLAPPGESPPAKEVAGLEESPTNAPNARSSQMDPQPSKANDSSYSNDLSRSSDLSDLSGAFDELGIGSISVDLLAQIDNAPVLVSEPAVDGATTIGGMDATGFPLGGQLDLAVAIGDLQSPGSASLALQGVADDELAIESDSEEGPADGVPSDEGAPEPRTLNFSRPSGEHLGVGGRASGSGSGQLADRIEATPVARAVNHVDHIEALAAKNAKVRIELNPLDLGPMTLQVSQEGKEIKAHVVVENPALRFALDRAQANLTAALSEAGMNLAQFSMERGTPQEQPAPHVFATPEKLLQKQRPTYTTTSQGLELWA